MHAAEIGQGHPCQPGQPSGMVVEGIAVRAGTSDRFFLRGNEQPYRLANLASDNPVPMPSGRRLTLYPMAETPDRYGRIAVHAFAGADWLQGRFLRGEQAYAEPSGTGEGCWQALLAAEPRTNALDARKVQKIAARFGLYTVVRGRVDSIGDRKRRLYLNFGSKWDEDVTASVAKTGKSRYRGDVALLATLTGKRVELRGMVEINGGPVIRLKDAAQIRLLSSD